MLLRLSYWLTCFPREAAKSFGDGAFITGAVKKIMRVCRNPRRRRFWTIDRRMMTFRQYLYYIPKDLVNFLTLLLEAQTVFTVSTSPCLSRQ